MDGIVEVIDDARQLVLENGSVLKEFAYGSAHTLGIGKPLILVECLEADRLHKGAVPSYGRRDRGRPSSGVMSPEPENGLNFRYRQRKAEATPPVGSIRGEC